MLVTGDAFLEIRLSRVGLGKRSDSWQRTAPAVLLVVC